jgi:lipopolysaccharide/colanic/teichoic acid biosynthesis glycosyltransferase
MSPAPPPELAEDAPAGLHIALGSRSYAASDRQRRSRVGPYLLRAEDQVSSVWLSPWCLSRAKRVLDFVGALVLLVLASPLMVAAAVAIKLDSPGPVLFRQWRTGFAGRRIRVFKFRTMRRDAEALKHSLRALNVHGPGSPDFKVLNDPRVTAVGRVLRRTSLDELPNLLNVLRGEMSLVGPRPTSFDIDSYADWHLARLAVPPGVTGLWQISGRCEVDFDDRVKLDCQYIRRQSPLLDLRILLQTPFNILGGRGAC